MAIVNCDVPRPSVLDRHWVEAAYFRDAYRAPLRDRHARLVDIFFALFAHLPWWMKLILIARNQLASWCGLSIPKASDVLHVQVESSYCVGDKIGLWPIFSQTETELVVGRDNKHLDFRLSVLKLTDEVNASVVVSTVCSVHNAYGRVYLFFVVPFHEWGLQRLIAAAIAAGRL